MRLSPWILIVVLAFSSGASAGERKCRKEIWPEAFRFLQQEKPRDADCDEYEYKLVDLNGDKENELIVYRRKVSCPPGGVCSNEVFIKEDGQVRHVATIPGTPAVQETVTKGYKDLVAYNSGGQKLLYQWDGQRYAIASAAAPVPVQTIQDNNDDPWSSLP